MLKPLPFLISFALYPLLAWPHAQEEPTGVLGELPLLSLLGLSGAWYACGLWRLLRASQNGRATVLRRGFMFGCGWLVIAVSLLSPLHELGGRSFTAHMIEHELLMLLAAPLMALSQPLGVFMWALPRRVRHVLGHTGNARWFSALWTRVSSPLNASLVQAAMLWIWHAPALFNRALQSEGWHTLQHLSLLFSALLFWWSINRASTLERKHGSAAAYLFFTSIHSGVLGALMTFAVSPWYWRYAAMGMSGTAGLSPLEDQQLAGLIMWIPGGAIHAVVALIYLRRWFNVPPRAVAYGIGAAALGGFLLMNTTDTEARELRVCADPNNLPFSDAHEAGFENRIVQVIARELDAKLTYVWWAQRRGNIRNTLNAGSCDVIPGVTSGLETLATTRPYYRSAYVFVSRADRHLNIRSFDDERLPKLTVGVQMIGDDFANTPPAHALSRRGMVDNVRGYMLYGDYAQDSPPRAIVEAVASGVIDVAVVWGPLAGYYAARSQVPLTLRVAPLRDGPALPMAFDISMGVRRKDARLLAELDAALAARTAEIADILRKYSVPQPLGPGAGTHEHPITDDSASAAGEPRRRSGARST